ncbi:trypsin-like peptidase domain-containing protein [Georgenia yuyongxinii]|uniref:Trypsin-like peptidase domain-containing protein n=1 Tax=Georgenia yuyongxinii TaxID=2589797 RepID=A0A5B8C1Z3_9MICO|nr:serine protease [Georgenia yuyongxinii]QDC24358.1 trypsin-like peptidase domain-containing protein [Georgenia yuyongxinii]
MRPSRGRAGALAAVVALALGGCGVLPAMPEELAESYVPEVPAPQVGSSGSLTPDGVAAAERMAVRVRNVGCGTLSVGSGFALDEHTVVTNRHVVEGSSELQVSTYDGNDIDVVTVASSSVADLALVRTTEPLPQVPGLAEGDPANDTPVTVVGYPSGGALTTSSGTVLGRVPDPLSMGMDEVIVTDAQVVGGSSGSAALDADGRVVGVVYAGDDKGHSFLVPLSLLAELLADESAFAPLEPCR